MTLTENLKWRYATKKFDTDKKVSIENIEKLKEAVQLAVSSYGLQLYKVLIVENKEIREKLKPVSWNQPQITDASHLFIFCNYTKVEESDVNEYLKVKAETQNLNFEDIKHYAEAMMKKINRFSPEELKCWTGKQTYIALSNLLSACAELKIDACPMEGFRPEEYNRILGLTERNLNAAVIAPVGYRSEADKTQYAEKVRKPIDLLFETI